MTRYREPPVRYPFSKLVQVHAEGRGWSPGQVARHAGVSPGTARRILAGRDVMLSSALKVAAALGLDTGTLGIAADLNRPVPLAGLPAESATLAAHPGEPPVRCHECTLCEKPGSLICNDPEGICHPGECEPEPE